MLQKKTSEVFKDGWFHSGDIGEIESDGKLKIIDRKKNMLELYINGRSEWFSATTVEGVLQQIPLIDQILLISDRNEPCLIGVILPSSKEHAEHEHDLTKLSNKIINEMKIIGEKNKLKPQQIPPHIILDKPGSWTIDNGLLTASGKLCRYKLLQKYRHAVTVAYTSLHT